MLDFSADLATFSPHLPMLDRIDAAAAAGFKAVEASDPYGVPADDMARRLKDRDMRFIMLALPITDATSDTDSMVAFRHGLDRAIDYAASIGCRYLTCPAAMTEINLGDAAQRDHLVAALRHAAARLMARSIRLFLEPLPAGSHGPHDLSGTLTLLNEVGSRNLSMNCGFGYGRAWEVPLARALERHLPRIGHIKIADGAASPGADGHVLEPERLLAALDRLGYCGWISCGGARDWLTPFLESQPPVLTWHGEPSGRPAQTQATA
ncbi:MAG: putative hydroxypyruvate isomerase [Rhodospirillales bacterium]|nr:putative hydroxypyruvate isomerase [Rhodospirillales bacterium]